MPFAVLVAIVLAACAALGGPRTVEIPQARLQALLAERFPLDRRLFDLIDVRILAPRLSLSPSTNRVALEVDFAPGARSSIVLNGRRPERLGTIGVTAGIRFEPSDNSLRLFDVHVERLDFEGLPALPQGQAAAAARRLVEGLLENQSVYALRPKDVAGLESRGYRPTEIVVIASGLAVTLVPVER